MQDAVDRTLTDSLHRVLNVTFGEDQSRVSKDHGAANLGLLRRTIVSLFKQDKGDKKSIRQRRLNASWNDDYLLEFVARAEAA